MNDGVKKPQNARKYGMQHFRSDKPGLDDTPSGIYSQCWLDAPSRKILHMGSDLYIVSNPLAKTGENVISDSIFPATRQEIETAKWPLKGKGRLAILLFLFFLRVCHLFWLQLVDFFWDLGLK